MLTTGGRIAVAGVWAGYAVAGGLVLAGASPPAPAPWSVVAVRSGDRTVAARPLSADDGFALAYVHSAYHAPTVELFAPAPAVIMQPVLQRKHDHGGGRGRFTMYAIASPNEAVLDYYAVAGSRTRMSSGWWLQRLDRPQVFHELPLIATPVGRRTLVTVSGCVPLYPRTGAYDLRIRVAPSRPAGRTAVCPQGVDGFRSSRPR